MNWFLKRLKEPTSQIAVASATMAVTGALYSGHPEAALSAILVGLASVFTPESGKTAQTSAVN